MGSSGAQTYLIDKDGRTINPGDRERQAVQDEIDLAREEESRIRKQQQALIEAERAKRSTLSTATKRSTIKTSAQGIPTTISGGGGNRPTVGDAATPNSGMNTIVGG